MEICLWRWRGLWRYRRKIFYFTNLAYLERIHPSGKNVTLGKEPPFRVCHDVIYIHTYIYNIAFANSERWLAKSRVDITQCQHVNVGKFLSLCFFVLYYKTNIKHFFRIDIQLYLWLYQHSWKLGKREIVWKHDARRAECLLFSDRLHQVLRLLVLST
jgi:hypothetical protein